MENKYAFGNAFQPSEKDRLNNEELRKKYKFQTWAPESVIPVGDTYVFYNNLEDLKGIGLGIHEHVSSVFNNKGYTKVNETLEYFNNNIINKLTVYEYLSELNDDMLEELKVIIAEEEKRREDARFEEEMENGIETLLKAAEYDKSRLGKIE